MDNKVISPQEAIVSIAEYSTVNGMVRIEIEHSEDQRLSLVGNMYIFPINPEIEPLSLLNVQGPHFIVDAIMAEITYPVDVVSVKI